MAVTKKNISKILARLEEAEKTLEPEPVDLVLAVFYAMNGQVPSRTHLQKTLFIASKHVDTVREALEFHAYRMGPWSEEVNDVIEQLEANNDVVRTDKGLALTRKGLLKAKKAWEKLGEEEKRKLQEIASFTKKMSIEELLLYTYTAYGYKEKSDILEKLLRKRKKIALNLLAKNLVSIELAAKIAGEPLPTFIKYLKKKGIKPLTAEVNDIDEATKI